MQTQTTDRERKAVIAKTLEQDERYWYRRESKHLVPRTDGREERHTLTLRDGSARWLSDTEHVVIVRCEWRGPRGGARHCYYVDTWRAEELGFKDSGYFSARLVSSEYAGTLGDAVLIRARAIWLWSRLTETERELGALYGETAQKLREEWRAHAVRAGMLHETE